MKNWMRNGHWGIAAVGLVCLGFVGRSYAQSNGWVVADRNVIRTLPASIANRINADCMQEVARVVREMVREAPGQRERTWLINPPSLKEQLVKDQLVNPRAVISPIR